MLEAKDMMEKIKAKTGKHFNEIDQLAKTKVAQANNMISYDGALYMVATDLGVKVVEDSVVTKESSYDFRAQTPQTTQSTSTVPSANVSDLTLEDFEGKYIKHPKIGEEVTFVLKKIQKNTDIKAIDPKTKQPFSTALPGKDYKIDYITSEDESFSPRSAEVVGKITGIIKKLKQIEGLKLRVKHVKDGFREKDGTDNYEVAVELDGVFKQLDRKTREWK